MTTPATDISHHRHLTMTGEEPVNVVQQWVSAAWSAQCAWRATSWDERALLFRRVRHMLVDHTEDLLEAVSQARPTRHGVQTLAAELLPTLEACRWLERRGRSVLKPRAERLRDRPWWLPGLRAVTHRDPWGVVLIVSPSNYPLMLPAIQALQALFAGNAVIVKPAPGCAEVMHAFAHVLEASGLPGALFQVTDTAPATAMSLIDAGVNKVVLTGSLAAGRAIHAATANQMTPLTAELSGCDAMVVLPGAELAIVVDAVRFGMVFNESQTCIAPRRLVADDATANELAERLTAMFEKLAAVRLGHAALRQVSRLVDAAVTDGATLLAGGVVSDQGMMQPILLDHVSADSAITRADMFAPVLSIVRTAADEARLAEMVNHCPMKLGASVFGPAAQAEAFADRLDVGCVTINDLIAPTADPRVTFGGRGDSGFGVTRGAEGLLAMTHPRVVLVQRGRRRPHYQPMDDRALPFARLAVQALHHRRFLTRVSAVVRLCRAAIRMKCGTKDPDRSGLSPSHEASDQRQEDHQ